MKKFDFIIKIDEVFDPKKINEITIYEVENSDQLCLFSNLRSLTILDAFYQLDCKKILPKI